MQEFYSIGLTDDARWHIEPDESDAKTRELGIWRFFKFKEWSPTFRPVYKKLVDGKPVDYTVTPFGTPIVSDNFARCLMSKCDSDVQVIPCDIRGEDGSWYIANVLSSVDCLDREKSQAIYYPANHPEKPNQPRMISRLIVRAASAEGHHFFRVKDWVSIIVSKSMRDEIIARKFTGMNFEPAG